MARHGQGGRAGAGGPGWGCALAVAGLAAGIVVAPPATAGGAPVTCSPHTTVLESPRLGSQEVQVKAVNDRGDVVGFADSSRAGHKAMHAILWKHGQVSRAVDLGVLPGYVASEAYGVNDHRVVVGLLYDRKGRTFPFRWASGRMTTLNGPAGIVQQVDVSQRNAINDRGQIVATLVTGGQRQAVRWSPDGTPQLLPALPGHTWTDVFGINDDGVVSGWSRLLPSEDGQQNPVVWEASGDVVALQTAPGRADGIAESTNTSGLTVGYLGNDGTDGIPGVPNTDPERDNAVVWSSRTAAPRMLGRPAAVHDFAELVDVNDRGQAVGMSGHFTDTGFVEARARIWRPGWTSLRRLPLPAAARHRRVVVAELNDVNNRGDVVGNVYGLAAKDYSALRSIHPVLWRCAFGG